METTALNYPKYFRIAIKEAKGSTIVDVDGNVFLDWVAGIAVMNLGHNNPLVRRAVERQLDSVWHALEVPTEVRVEFLKKFKETLSFDPKVLFTTTGADACEAAVKVARWKTRRRKVIAFEGAYHGITAGTLGLTFESEYKRFTQFYDDMVVRVPYPYTFRCDHQDCLNHTLEAVAEAVRLNIDDVAAIMVEPILGEGGYVVPPEGFLRGLREIADRWDLVMIVDEVQTGVGRTGKVWAHQWENITPDIMCASKAIGSGIPMSLVAYRKDLVELPRAFHLGTYRGNPLGLAAGKAVLDGLTEELLERVRTVGERLRTRFQEINEEVADGKMDVRGKGFMIGFELVRDEKRPWPEGTVAMIGALLKRGVLMYKCGIHSNVLRFMAPLTTPEGLLDRGLDAFASALREVLSESGPSPATP
ncbi:aspartate aminotransferase family protein [Sulfodiicoccus acidiphilus]|uniref:Aspartate aminotransferase family protein n=2 Tax=Sulfodiicoccus acidiphilus TaxID=1670455 RepID=A0A348B410_9CREN|nr:aspartate aminotransferase family protein [Sulfodiicoccus acidiphilus]BBD72912.1 aspartate aminotransferase family protein [Sulfodiicoccus acidiphilus]GGT88062.1 aspartate aminotransferase family protein [Sulfodiicoccus acidiphilus]